MKNQRNATLLALLAVLFWSTAGSAFKLSLKYADPFQLFSFASLVSLAVFAAYVTLNKKWKPIFNTPLKGILHSALLGFLNPFAYYAILLNAYDMLRAQEALILNYTWPLVLVLLSVPILKQKIGWISMLAIFISFTGAVTVITHGDFRGLSFSNPAGTLMALGSSLIWALFWIQNLRDSRDDINKMFFNFLFGSMYSLLATSIFSDFKIPPPQGFAGIVYIGLFEMGFTFLIWMKALQLSTTTAKITNLIFISPCISLILIHFLVGEPLMASSVAGLAMVLGGIWLQRKDQSKKNHM